MFMLSIVMNEREICVLHHRGSIDPGGFEACSHWLDHQLELREHAESVRERPATLTEAAIELCERKRGNQPSEQLVGEHAPSLAPRCSPGS
jgi:hypothetical protein